MQSLCQTLCSVRAVKLATDAAFGKRVEEVHVPLFIELQLSFAGQTRTSVNCQPAIHPADPSVTMLCVSCPRIEPRHNWDGSRLPGLGKHMLCGGAGHETHLFAVMTGEPMANLTLS